MHYSNAATLQAKINQRIGQRDSAQQTVKDITTQVQELKRDLTNTEQAQVIAQTIAQQTQQQLEYSISNIVTLALGAVFEEAYEFKIEFVQKRNKTEAEITFIRGDSRVDPMDAAGGGAVDIAAFALRVALWKLAGAGQLINTLILDEPFRFLSRELQPRAGSMLKLLSDKLGLQFIVVTHNQDLIEAADKVFEVKNKRGVSHVTTNGGEVCAQTDQVSVAGGKEPVKKKFSRNRTR